MAAPAASPPLSKRILATDEPVIIQMRELIQGAKDVLSLAQGIVYWKPPQEAIERAQAVAGDASVSAYGVDDGNVELRAALVEKVGLPAVVQLFVTYRLSSSGRFLVSSPCPPACFWFYAFVSGPVSGPVPGPVKRENNLTRSSIMVTHGAQQAFINAVLATCDPADPVALFAPYYFNHLMAFQMSGCSAILRARSDPATLQPDPGGPLEPPWLSLLTHAADPTPETLYSFRVKALAGGRADGYFMYDGFQHECVEGPHVINLFSFSKAYGMMGWRVGYIAYPKDAPGLGAQLLKVQDTIPICANLVAQEAAMAALQDAGRAWVQERVATLVENRALAIDALAPLGDGAAKGGDGGIFVWARLPPQFSDADRDVVKWLVDRHGVCVIPGSASGGPGFVRVSFGNLDPKTYRVAAARLKRGLQELVTSGMAEGPRVDDDATLGKDL
eukprot:jgi/Mesen1/4911/ME000245S03965